MSSVMGWSMNAVEDKLTSGGTATESHDYQFDHMTVMYLQVHTR